MADRPGATVHLYGKGPPRPGRKMGHATQVGTIPQKRLIGTESAIWALKAAAIGFPPVDILGFG